MNTILSKPHIIIFLAIPVLILAGMIFPEYSIDIQLSDTYYVITNAFYTTAGSFFLLLVGLIYWLTGRTGKRFNAILSALHLLLTIWIMVMLALPIFNTLKHPLLFFECLAILLLAQVLFLINIIITLLRK